MPTILSIGPYTLTLETEPEIKDVLVTDEQLTVALTDGRTLHVPLDWYPRLVHATSQERENWEVMGEGYGIEWSDLDEYISLMALLAGRKSGESQQSLNRWLTSRINPTNPHDAPNDQEENEHPSKVDQKPPHQSSKPEQQPKRDLVVILESDITQVFQTPEQVKSILRALIEHMPASPPPDTTSAHTE